MPAIPGADAPGAQSPSTTTTERALLCAAAGVFLIHALNYLYFFVDDEGIPFVFARNLLRGRGLVYNSFEGRVEGYSDFLHVLVSAGWLWLAGALHLGSLAPFFLGKAVAFASGTATVIVVWATMRRFQPTMAGLAAGLAFLVTFAPLATWSCSSLEMASVGLLVAVAVLGLAHDSAVWDAVTMGGCVALVLERIDGFVFVGALLVPALMAAGKSRRRRLWRDVAMPVMAALVLYHSWRVLYFGEWLSSPLAAKVLYKLVNTSDVVRYDPPVAYLAAFLDQYGRAAAFPAVALVAAGAVRDRRVRPLLVTLAALLAYAWTVGDWMRGFRFLVPAAPVFSVLVASAVSRIRRPAIAWTLTAAVCAWLGGAALRTAGSFDTLEYRESWWAHPSLDTGRYFSRYLRLSEDLKPIVPPGSTTAYNQAGIVPYLLDLDNVDDLGICSRFISHLPTSDVVFTEAGRYSPLTNETALRTTDAYLLYRSPQYVIEPLRNLNAVNSEITPNEVLRGRYALRFADSQAAVYQRTGRSTQEFRTNPRNVPGESGGALAARPRIRRFGDSTRRAADAAAVPGRRHAQSHVRRHGQFRRRLRLVGRARLRARSRQGIGTHGRAHADGAPQFTRAGRRN